MKTKLCLYLLLFSAAAPLWAQQAITYAYDANGNRIAREILIGNKSALADDERDYSPMLDNIGRHDIKIYPNPTRGMLRVDVLSLDGETISISVYDMNGRMIQHIGNADNVNAVDLTSHDDGVYLMKISQGAESRTWKIIKR